MDEQSTSDPVSNYLNEGELGPTMVPQENPTTTTTTNSSEMVHQSECTALDTGDQMQPTTTTTATTSNHSAPVDLPSTAAPQLIVEDSLQSDHVEMTVPVMMSNEETHVQITNELEPTNGGAGDSGGAGLQNGPQQGSPFEKDLLADDDLEELSRIADGLDIEDIQCLQPSLTDEHHNHHNFLAQEEPFLEENPPASSSFAAADEQHHSQITESATTTNTTSTTPTTTTTSTASTSFQMLELDGSTKESSAQLTTTGSSAETELIDDDLKEAMYNLEDELDELDQMDHGAYSQSTTTDAATILDTDSSKDGTVSELAVATALNVPEVPDLFKDVKFAISEEMEDLDKIKRALVANGAKFLNYLTDSATHVIADKPEYSFVNEASEIYEKPVVTSQWVWLSLRSRKILPDAPFSPFPDRLFSSVVVCPSRLHPKDQSAIWSMITYHGGRYQVKLDGSCTHLVTASIAGPKYETIMALKSAAKCKIVTPDWVVDCLKQKSLLAEERYHPRLLIIYNADKKVVNDRKKKDSGSDKQQKQSTMLDDESSLFTKTTKSVTMAISTAAVLSRKVEPFKPELLATTSPPAPPMITSPPLVLTPLPNQNSTTSTTSSANVQTHHHHPSHHHNTVPNSSTLSILSPRQVQNPQALHQHQQHHHQQQQQHLHHQQQQKQQFHPHATHPHPHQQSTVQLMNHGGQMNVATPNAYQQQHQQQAHGVPNRHIAPMSAVHGQGMQQQMQQQMQQHNLGPGAMHPAQHPMMNNQQQQTQHLTAAQKRKQNAAAAAAGTGQVNAVKSKGPGTKGPSKAALKKQAQQLQLQQQQQQQQMHQHAHTLPQEHGVHQLDPMMSPGVQQAHSAVPQTGYHPNQGMMQSQQHPQMVNNQTMHSPNQYRQSQPGPAMVAQQQQMGGMVQQPQQQQAPIQHPQQQAVGPRQVYMQQQINQQQPQQMQFVNGQGQFVRGQFIARPQQQPHQQQQQHQAQAHPQMGPGQQPPQLMSPGQQQMYRHPGQQQFAAMQQQQQQSQQQPPQQQRTMAYPGTQGQMMTQQGQPVYVGQHQQGMQQQQQRMQMPPQQRQSPQQQVVPQHQSPTGQPTVTVNAGQQQQQAMMNQNQYGQQQMQAQNTVHHQPERPPSAVASSMSPGAVVSPGHGPYPQQQQSVGGVPRMPMNMIRMSNLTPEQQQMIMQQQKMQQQQQQQQAGYQANMQQQTGHLGGQPMIRPIGPVGVNSGQSSPHTPPQMLSPNGSQVPQRMMIRPAMVQQQQQQGQQVYGQQQMVVDPNKMPVGPQQQQPMVRPPVPMQTQAGLQQQQQPGSQQFVPPGQQQQQQQFIRQRWPMSAAGDQQQFPGNKPQFVQHMGGPGPRQMLVSPQQHPQSGPHMQQGPPPHLTPQQQQMWIQRQRFFLQQQQQQLQQNPQARMIRMNGPMMMQQQQMPPQSPMHPSMMGMGPDGHPKMTQQQAVSSSQQQLQHQHSMDGLPTTTSVASHGSGGVDMASHAVHTGHQGQHVLQPQQQTTPQSSQMAVHSNAVSSDQQPPQLVPVHVFGSTAGGAAHPHHPHQQMAQPPQQQSFSGVTQQTLGGPPVGHPGALQQQQQQQHHHHPGVPMPPLNGHMAVQRHMQLPSHQHSQQVPPGGMVRTLLPPGHHQARMVHHQHLQGVGGVQHSPLHPLHIVTHAHPLPSQSQMVVVPQQPQPQPQQQPGTNGPQIQQVQPSNVAGVPTASPSQPVHIRFYGHEQTRTVIPPELSLIGCVFYIAPSYTSENEATSRLVAGWKRRIEKFGGRVVDQYVPGPGNNVTHVVTENMNGGVQQLALADNRRCVSVFWLDDTLGYERLLPPWRFYHLPFAGTTPCKNMIISTSNFDREERKMMKQLIQRTGAVYTEYLTSKNTVLICKKLKGHKYERAVHWRVAIVNILWLQDVLFGNTDALQFSKLPTKYQTFDENTTFITHSVIASTTITPSQMVFGDTFHVDYNLVSNFMTAWRNPISFDHDELEMKVKRVKEEKRLRQQEEDERRKEKMRLEEDRRMQEQMEQQKELEKMLASSETAACAEPITIKEEEAAERNEEVKTSELAALLSEATSLANELPSVSAKRSFDEMDSSATQETQSLTNGPLSAEEEPSTKRQKLGSSDGDNESSSSKLSTELQADQPMLSIKAAVQVAEMEVVEISAIEKTKSTDSDSVPESVEEMEKSKQTASESDSKRTESKSSTEEVMEIETETEPRPPTLSELLSETDEPDIVTEKQPSKEVISTADQQLVDEVFESASEQPESASSLHQQQPSVIPLVVSELSEGHTSTEKPSVKVSAKVPTPNVPSTSTSLLLAACSSSSMVGSFQTPSLPPPPPPPRSAAISALFTAVDGATEVRQELQSIVESLGGKVVSDHLKCTHLITDHVLPTVKYLCAFARARHILHSDWLRACGQAGAFIEEAAYTLCDQSGEATYRVDLAKALADRTVSLFKGTVFLLTRSLVPSPPVVARIIEANGGKVVLFNPPNGRQLAKLQEKGVQFVVVSCETDLHTCDRFFENQIKVVTVQCIINAILRQQVDYEGHALRSTKEQQAPPTISSSGNSNSLSTTITINGGGVGVSPQDSNNNVCKQMTPNCSNSNSPPLPSSAVVTSATASNQANGGGSSSSFGDFLVPPAGAASATIVNH